MKIENRITITYLYPGTLFPESSSEPVSSKNLPKTVPADCYGFYFTETEVAISLDGKEYLGEPKSESPTYIIGEAIRVEDIPAVDRGQDTNILKSNIRSNSPTKTGIKTHLGNWQMESDTMVAVSPKQFKFGKPTIYKNLKK